MALIADTSEDLSRRAAIPPMPVCRFSVDRYQEMIRAGIIVEDDPLELLDGWLVPKMTKNAPHVFALGLVRKVIERILPDGRIEEYADPAGSDEAADYGRRRDYSRGDEISLVLDGRHVASIPVGELLPCCREQQDGGSPRRLGKGTRKR